MRYLIVNADDLGASPGITRGILEAHVRGIVTSASLMVDTASSAGAAALARSATALSVGLHVVLPGDDFTGDLGAELRRQVDRFATLMGGLPTHIDSHHNAHRDPRLLAGFLNLSRLTRLPLREHSPVRYFSKFYGQWGGQSHPEHIGVDSLARMLKDEVGEGITELSCHPGYADPREPSGYTVEREVEVRTLCDPRIPAELAALGITLVNYHDLGRLASNRAQG